MISGDGAVLIQALMIDSSWANSVSTENVNSIGWYLEMGQCWYKRCWSIVLELLLCSIEKVNSIGWYLEMGQCWYTRCWLIVLEPLFRLRKLTASDAIWRRGSDLIAIIAVSPCGYCVKPRKNLDIKQLSKWLQRIVWTVVQGVITKLISSEVSSNETFFLCIQFCT
jgi:hypothetical protein